MIDRDALTEATLELAAESGAVVDKLKKVLYHGHELDHAELQEGLSRVAGSLAHLIVASGEAKPLRYRLPLDGDRGWGGWLIADDANPDSGDAEEAIAPGSPDES